MLKWARENDCPWDEETCAKAAKGGYLEVLKWARERVPGNGRAVGDDGGHLEVLKWARENGCPWNERTCASAAEGGHLEMLKWARENGCPWNEDVHARGGGGHLRC